MGERYCDATLRCLSAERVKDGGVGESLNDLYWQAVLELIKRISVYPISGKGLQSKPQEASSWSSPYLLACHVKSRVYISFSTQYSILFERLPAPSSTYQRLLLDHTYPQTDRGRPDRPAPPY
jgi:hypothetical protein